MKQWVFDLALWLASWACVVVAGWCVDWRLGLAGAGLALIWLSRPRLWREP